MANSYTTVPSTVRDGIFLIYSSGYFRRFDESIKASDKDGVKYIGIIYNHKSFAVALHDLGTYPIIRGGVPTPTYMDFVEHTQIVQNAGANIPLPTGEYLPTAEVMGVLQYLFGREIEDLTKFPYGICNAFDFVGGTKIEMWHFRKNEFYKYWIIDEYYTTYVYESIAIGDFAVNNLFGEAKYGAVRPIAKFIYNSEYLLGSSEPANTNVILSFSTMAKKDAFCDLLGADAQNGDAVLQLIQ